MTTTNWKHVSIEEVSSGARARQRLLQDLVTTIADHQAALRATEAKRAALAAAANHALEAHRKSFSPKYAVAPLRLRFPDAAVGVVLDLEAQVSSPVATGEQATDPPSADDLRAAQSALRHAASASEFNPERVSTFEPRKGVSYAVTAARLRNVADWLDRCLSSLASVSTPPAPQKEKRVVWFVSAGGVAKSGPYASQVEAYNAVRLRVPQDGCPVPQDTVTWCEEVEA